MMEISTALTVQTLCIVFADAATVNLSDRNAAT